MSRVRSEPRNTRKLVTKPSAAATNPPRISATTGSLMMPYLATRPEKYPAMPKNAAWPSDRMPA